MMFTVDRLDVYYGESHVIRSASFVLAKARRWRSWAATGWARPRCSSH